MSLTITDHDGGPEDEPAVGPSLVLVFEHARLAAGSLRQELADARCVAIGRGAVRGVRRDGETLVISVPDPRMSERHARLVRELGQWTLEDLGSKNGAIVNGTRLPRAVLADGDCFELGQTTFLFRDDGELFAPHLDAPTGTLATFVPALARAFRDLRTLAATATPVLIEGETGTGKERVAREVHALAGRRGAFVAVNCGALPPSLVESELFGYRRGAFTGAAEDRLGLVRSADGGTLFLDEIGDLDLASQAALLRVLQEREVVPLGATRPISVDVRLVAATHRDLAQLVERDQFRRDLYARIAGHVVALPPARERREDFGILIAAMLATPASLTAEAARAILRYAWPNNLRELDAALRVATALAAGDPIKPSHLPPPLRALPAPAPAPKLDRPQLEALLREHKGNISALARATKRSRAQVHRWLERFALDPAAFR